jgi:hypothetical protein
MSRMRLLTVSGRTPDKREDGDLGQGKALVQDGGQEAVGQGEDGPAADAGCDQPRAVAAALVQARVPLLVMRRHQRGDQGVPLLGRSNGPGRELLEDLQNETDRAEPRCTAV